MDCDTYIDGVSLRESCGAFVLDGSLKGVAAFPALKDVEEDEWQECDGADADLSAPALGSREVTLSFGLSGADAASGLSSLRSLLRSSAEHTFLFGAAGGREVRLRLTGEGTLRYRGRLATLSCSLSADRPLDGYVWEEPVACADDGSGLSMDGHPLSYWGACVSDGAADALLGGPEVRANLLRDLPGVAGAEYDTAGPVRLGARTLALPLHMRASDAATFWRDRDALLWSLSRPGARELTWDRGPAGTWTAECRHSSMEVSSLAFPPAGGAWMGFTLSLRVLSESWADADDDTDEGAGADTE